MFVCETFQMMSSSEDDEAARLTASKLIYLRSGSLVPVKSSNMKMSLAPFTGNLFVILLLYLLFHDLTPAKYCTDLDKRVTYWTHQRDGTRRAWCKKYPLEVLHRFACSIWMVAAQSPVGCSSASSNTTLHIFLFAENLYRLYAQQVIFLIELDNKLC